MFIRRRCVADFDVFRYEGPKSTYQTCKSTCAHFQRCGDGRSRLTITRRRFVLAVDADEIDEAYRWSLDVVVALDADIDETGGV